MSDATRLIDAAAAGDRRAAVDLLPLVHDGLRKLAAARLASAAPGQTLQSTALVHEAHLRLVGREPQPDWENRGHFFAEAMRRILTDRARGKATAKRGEPGADRPRADRRDRRRAGGRTARPG